MAPRPHPTAQRSPNASSSSGLPHSLIVSESAECQARSRTVARRRTTSESLPHLLRDCNLTLTRDLTGKHALFITEASNRDGSRPGNTAWPMRRSCGSNHWRGTTHGDKSDRPPAATNNPQSPRSAEACLIERRPIAQSPRRFFAASISPTAIPTISRSASNRRVAQSPRRRVAFSPRRSAGSAPRTAPATPPRPQKTSPHSLSKIASNPALT